MPYCNFSRISNCRNEKICAILFLGVQVMAARYLSRKSGRGILFSPFVEVEINGADYDNAKYKTKSVSDNGFNPDWNDSFDFQIHVRAHHMFPRILNLRIVFTIFF